VATVRAVPAASPPSENDPSGPLQPKNPSLDAHCPRRGRPVHLRANPVPSGPPRGRIIQNT
jgi:hypothetical protein